jgi:hypothetical protein
VRNANTDTSQDCIAGGLLAQFVLKDSRLIVSWCDIFAEVPYQEMLSAGSIRSDAGNIDL